MISTKLQSWGYRMVEYIWRSNKQLRSICCRHILHTCDP